MSDPSKPGRSGAAAQLAARLAGEGRPLLLDGATGTELERAGIPTGLPLWSTHALLEAPEVVRQIHARYVAAGVEVITANTFRTQRRTLARAGRGARDRELTRRALALADEACREAPGDAPIWRAGSLPPLEDCYAPERVPEEAALATEHGRQAELLAEAGADLLLLETMNSIREARAAARAAHATGLPFVVGFVSWKPDRILSGEALSEAARRVIDEGALAVGVNCVPPATLPASLAALAPLRAPLLVSPNLGAPEPETGFARSEDLSPNAFAACLDPWIQARLTPTRGHPRGAALVGSCCGTGPDHSAALAARFDLGRQG